VRDLTTFEKLSNLFSQKQKKEPLLSGTPFSLLIFNYLKSRKRVSAVPFSVSEKEAVQVKAETKLAVVHCVLLYCCAANVRVRFLGNKCCAGIFFWLLFIIIACS